MTLIKMRTVSGEFYLLNADHVRNVSNAIKGSLMVVGTASINVKENIDEVGICLLNGGALNVIPNEDWDLQCS